MIIMYATGANRARHALSLWKESANINLRMLVWALTKWFSGVRGNFYDRVDQEVRRG